MSNLREVYFLQLLHTLSKGEPILCPWAHIIAHPISQLAYAIIPQSTSPNLIYSIAKTSVKKLAF
jgi:hypothetical protein